MTRKNKNNETNLPLTISSKDGLVDQVTFFNKTVASKDMSGYYLLKKGEYAYNKSYSVGYDFGSIKRLDRYPMGALSTLYICFALTKYNSDYIKTYFDSLKWYKEIYMISAEGARNHGLLNVPTDEFFDTYHYITENKAEQEKIAKLMELIEQRIQKQQALVDNLKKYKRGLISGILNGEIRIPGVNQKMWKEAPLDKLFTISAGGDIEKEHCSPTKTEKYKFPVFANALANDGLYGFADYYKVCENTITVTGRGEVGHATSRYEKYVPIVRLLTLVPKEKVDIEFFTLYINQTKIFIESTGVPQLTSPQLGKLKVLVPTYEEQKRISNIVNGLEHKIKSEQSYGCLLKNLRKALLQQLFI